MLTVEDVTLSFGRHRVLDQISFSLEQGRLCGLFGPNGSGKTTLFQCCLGFIRPDSGRIRIRERNIRQMPIRDLARQMAYVPQHHASAFSFRVEEVVLMGRTPHMNRWFRPSRPDRAAAAQAIDRVGISALARAPYNLLSGGQQQLVLIARAIAQDTEFILLDEPTSALDFRNQTLVWEILRELADRGRGILACSHDPNHVAWFCDSTLVLDPGGVAASGAPERVFSQDLMDRIYGGACRVTRVMDKTIILPRGVAGAPHPSQPESRHCMPLRAALGDN